MTDARTEVLIVGGGPVGLFLGCLLAVRGTRFQILERRPEPSAHSRAVGIHPPALEAFGAIGLRDALLAAGVCMRRGIVRDERGALGELSFSGVSIRSPFVLALPQAETERLLEQRLSQLAPGAMRRGAEVVGIKQEPESITATFVEHGQQQSVQARFLIGADGCRSLIRELTGTEFPGETYPDRYLMGDFPETTAYGPDAVIYLVRGGVVESFPLPNQKRRWVVRRETLPGEPAQHGVQPTAQDVAEVVMARTGLHLPAQECSMVSAFDVRHHMATRMVAGRVLLIGDAAHEVSPIGGQGMNLGWLDAVALAPLLERAVQNGPGDAAATRQAFSAYERRRQRSARLATRQAELNMLAGRPWQGNAHRLRGWMVTGVLATPARSLLANAFTMRWL